MRQCQLGADKGALAWESCTSTQLVSPAASGEKKNDPCRIGLCNLKSGTLKHNTVSTDDPHCSTAQIDNFMIKDCVNLLIMQVH